ncbi:putative oxidoreductase [Mycobacterium tuberculosis H37Rv] [Mycobacterium shimoidei]|uniref:Putative oxidoreductase [Mycobacterium tuberculosis H37Rv] n=1 Tax=Mycobacterium shimoidei TaxID=29313 RepID=A0A375Z1B5_MYCSH|nr:SDR family oxidoreductase [Mycobacterium shimoidei]SRX94973.1 putative oxidoreductase [Mycobacterium tuberculosis H37Rv] [Mycobacterium shimoidei]
MASVDSQVVFITGGAGGIGAELARRLHAKGAKLVLTDLDRVQLETLARELGDDRVLTVVADVRDLAAMQSAADAAVERFGGIDTVVANAGIISHGSVLHVDPEAFRRLIDVNVLGVFHTVRAALPSVIERRGYVLIVSSMAAYTAAPGLAPYNASKAGVELFANALRLEVAHLGVAVGAAHMLWIDTPMVQDSRAEFSAFSEMLSRLPFPFNRTTSVHTCAQAFVKGIERRKRRINVPRWVAAARWLKPVFSTRVGELPVQQLVPELLPRIDAEVAALGRSVSSHTKAIEKP